MHKQGVFPSSISFDISSNANECHLISLLCFLFLVFGLLNYTARDWAPAISSGSVESNPAGPQEIPWMSILSKDIHYAVYLVHPVMSNFLHNTMACSSPRLLCHGDSQARSTGMGLPITLKTLNANLVMSHQLYKSKMCSYSSLTILTKSVMCILNTLLCCWVQRNLMNLVYGPGHRQTDGYTECKVYIIRRKCYKERAVETRIKMLSSLGDLGNF